MNIKQLVADGAYTVFARMGAENKAKQIESVKYIKQLASTTEVNIDDWDIVEIFGTERGNNLVLDRREINKRFMEHTQKASVAAATAAKPDTDPRIIAMNAQINTLVKSSILSRISEITRQRDNFLRDANSYMTRANEHVAAAAQHSMNLLSLQKQELDFAGQVNAIQQGGFWKFHSFEANQMVFTSVNDLILREKNKAHGIDFSVNFGKFKVFVGVNNSNVIVKPLENNLSIGSSIHPHISSERVCWGGAGQMLNQKLALLDFAGVMQILANVLSDYNADNPYAVLWSFYEESHFKEAIKMRSDGKSLTAVKKYFTDNNIDLRAYSVQSFFESRDPKRGYNG